MNFDVVIDLEFRAQEFVPPTGGHSEQGTLLMRTVRVFERATDWHRKRPGLL